jgi:chemotaxis signal transduction protein
MSQSETYVLFELAGATYGLRTSEVQHMEMLERITPVPNTSPAVEGVVFSRGQVVPAVNLRVRFGLPREAHTIRSRLIIVQVQQRLVGLIVDAAREFATIGDEAMRPIQDAVTGMEGNYLKGIATQGERLILLLDLEATLDLGTVIQVPSPSELTTRVQAPAEKEKQQPAYS